MKPCPHGQSRRHEVWHHPKGSPTLLEMARLCVDCVQREQRAGVHLLRADGVTPFVLPADSKQKPAVSGEEEPVPRVRKTTIVCSVCGETKPHKAKGMCGKCSSNAYYHAKAGAKKAARVDVATVPAPAPAPVPPQPHGIPGDSGGPMVKDQVAVDEGEVERLRAELADAQARLEAWELWHGLTTRGQSSAVLLRNLLHLAAGGAVGA